MSLRDEILAIVDIEVKEITVPKHIKGWGGKSIYIKQLTRGQQDALMKRQTASMKMKQNINAQSQEVTMGDIYGHDAWICVKGICEQNGEAVFTEKDIELLNAKSGEAIGWISAQIIEYSGMKEDLKSAEQVTKEELKN